MPTTLRICLFDRTAAVHSPFRSAFDMLMDVQVLDHCAAWRPLQEHLGFGTVDAVAVNLDQEDAAARLLTVQRIAELAPDCPIVAVSSDDDPDLIIQAMRSGCSQFIRSPIQHDDLTAAIERIRKRHLPVAEGCQQIAVIGSAGGAGSTTLACNLALDLARLTGRSAGLVDMDLQFGDVADAFHRTPERSLADLCRTAVGLDPARVEAALDRLPCNVSLLARPQRIEDAREVDPDRVEQLFLSMAQLFPFVIVDVPRQMSPVTARTLRASGQVFIVSQLAPPFLRNATRVHEALVKTGVDERRIELVLNRCHAEHERIRPADAEKHFGRAAYAVIPNDYKHVTAARDLGYPVIASAPTSPARLAVQSLARRIATAHLGEELVEVEPNKRGLLRLFRRKPRAETVPG